MFENADLIHAYTRANAIADGTLIDVSEVTREAGFRFPVALPRSGYTLSPRKSSARTNPAGCGTC
jgi:hypothetical protein